MENILNSRKWDISFYQNGKIDITAWVTKKLGIRAGDAINVCADKSTGEHYFYVQSRKETIVGRRKAVCWRAKRGNYLRSCSTELSRYMRRICKSSGDIHLQCGEMISLPVIGNAITLITKNMCNE